MRICGQKLEKWHKRQLTEFSKNVIFVKTLTEIRSNTFFFNFIFCSFPAKKLHDPFFSGCDPNADLCETHNDQETRSAAASSVAQRDDDDGHNTLPVFYSDKQEAKTWRSSIFHCHYKSSGRWRLWYLKNVWNSTI